MSSSFEDQLISYVRDHAEDGIFLDTNVLLLLLVAQFRPTLIGTERLKAYEKRDADLLTCYVSQFKRILTTPHVLTETSNFVRQMVKGRAQAEFAEWLHPLFCLEEKNSLTQTIAEGHEVSGLLFVRLGLTDSSLAASISTKRLLLTADLDLHVATVSQGGRSINFTHMREAAGFL